MNLIPKFIEQKPVKDILTGFYAKVLTQALRHNTRSEYTELYNIARPNEEPIYVNWRDSNKRRFTVDVINRFRSMIKRCFKQTFEVIISEYFTNIEELRYELLDLSRIDPNAVHVMFPVNSTNSVLPLSIPFIEGGQNPSEKIKVKEIIVYSDLIIQHSSEEYILFIGENTIIDEQSHDVFYGVDNFSFWKILPFKKSDGTIGWQEVHWYEHNLGYLPITYLPGLKTLENSSKEYYKESYCFPAYEILDEAVIALSTDQVNRMRHLSPKLVTLQDIECPTCNGQGFDAQKNICKACSGSGKITSFGDFSTIKLSGTRGFGGEEKTIANPIFYLQPPNGLEYSRTVWIDFLEMAEKSLCTDMLEGTGNESGIAKNLRMEPRQDIIEAIGSDFYEMTKRLLKIKADLLFIEDVTEVKMPTRYNSKSVELLKNEVINSVPGERFMKFMDYIKNSYKGNTRMVDVYYYSVLYAPLLIYNQDEIINAVGVGAYSETDIIKKDYAVHAISLLLPDKAIVSIKELFSSVDKYLTDIGVLKGIEPINGDLDQVVLDQSNKEIANTVGGVTGLIGISTAVARGEMTEKAAENILKLVYGYTQEQASSLIDVPEKKIEQSLDGGSV